MGNILNLYVANLGKYNEGKLVGGWISLPVEDDELKKFLIETVEIDIDPEEAFYKGMDGEPVYEEWAIHDVDSDFFGHIDEYDDIYALNEKAREISELNDYELKSLEAAVEIFGSEALEYEVDDIVLLEDVNSHYDLGYYWAVDSGCYELDDKSVLSRYFDYEAKSDTKEA